jgi:hypothetical protein
MSVSLKSIGIDEARLKGKRIKKKRGKKGKKRRKKNEIALRVSFIY